MVSKRLAGVCLFINHCMSSCCAEQFSVASEARRWKLVSLNPLWRKREGGFGILDLERYNTAVMQGSRGLSGFLRNHAQTILIFA